MAVDTFDKLPPASLLTLNGTSPHQIFHSISTTALPDTYLANLSENDMSVMDQPTVRMVFLVAYVAVLFFCVFGNIMILIVIIGNSSMRTVTNFFLANLAIADLLVGAWPFGPTLCHAYIYILHMIPNSSAGILVLLSIERFIAVIRPMLVSHLLTKSVLVLCTGLVWSLSATMNIPYLVAVQFIELYSEETNERFGICTRKLIDYPIDDSQTGFEHAFEVLKSIALNLKLVSTVNLVVWYIIPLTLLGFIYASIGLVLWRTADEAVRNSQVGARISNGSHPTASRQRSTSHYSKLRKHSSAADSAARRAEYRQRLLQGEVIRKFSDGGLGSLIDRARELSTTPGPSDDRRNSTSDSERRLSKSELVDTRKRVIRLCAVIVLAFAIFSMPRYLYFTWSVWRETNAPRCLNCLSALIQPTTFLLMFFNSGLNPILYAFLSQRFRAAIKDTLNFRHQKEERKEQLLMALRSHRFSEQVTDHRNNNNLVNGHSATCSANSRNYYTANSLNLNEDGSVVDTVGESALDSKRVIPV